ncbi:hypothetical protein ACHAPJ_012084 [Fusarium lateritium]
MSSLPPDFDPRALSLREATEEEKFKCWRNNSQAWRGNLSVDEYIGLQAVNGNQELTLNGGIRYWIFTDGAEIYCSGQTIRKPVVSRRAGHEEAKKQWSYGVAAVFTPPEYRSRGIASAMMKRLAEWFDGNDASCSMLADHIVLCRGSNVDFQGFYERFGWSIVPTREIRIPVEYPAKLHVDSRVTWLAEDDLRDLCQADEDSTAKALRSGVSSDKQDNTTFAFLPTYATAKWHFGAEEYLASILPGLPQKFPVNKGATITGGKVCYWVHDFNSGRLTVLRFHIPSAGADDEAGTLTDVVELLKATIAEAAAWGLNEVASWDPEPRLFTTCDHLGIEPKVREEIENYIPCLRWKGENGNSESDKSYDWVLRQAYQRC